jgi:uncharacterized membrane protein YfcA
MTVALVVVVGLLAGTMAAALGVGGGIVFVPALVVLLDFTQHEAQGTSLAVIIPTAIIATIVHARHGRVDWRAAVPVALGGAVGALAGAALALRLDGELLRRLFAVLLIALAIRMLLQTRRPSTNGAHPLAADGNIDPSG